MIQLPDWFGVTTGNVLVIWYSSLDIVSDFDIRISDLNVEIVHLIGHLGIDFDVS